MTTPLSTDDVQAAYTMLCTGQMANGAPYWAYVQIPRNKVEAFMQAQAEGAFQLEDYGTILEWGEGVSVPAAVKRRMEKDFGVQHDMEDNLRDAVLQAKAEFERSQG
mgnify:CR=1 FL=1|tara:strand:- start:820 stop:1140 length:321 start_codon:yes stop_codon:yes gene_type:complete